MSGTSANVAGVLSLLMIVGLTPTAASDSIPQQATAQQATQATPEGYVKRGLRPGKRTRSRNEGDRPRQERQDLPRQHDEG